MSFSGSERNSMFIKSDDGRFSNVSGVSGFDSKSDGRCLATMDINRDGLMDLLTTNANKPTLAIESQSTVDDADSGVRITSYRSNSVVDLRPSTLANQSNSPIQVTGSIPGQTTIVIGMATWCDKCIGEIPNMVSLKKELGSQVRFLAIPIDKDDTQAKLDQFKDKYNPPYELKPTPGKAVKLTEFVAKKLGSAKTPFSVVLSSKNDVLLTKEGIPTISEIRQAVDAN